MAKVFIIEDDEVMADCIELAVSKAFAKSDVDNRIFKFTNAITAAATLNDALPDLIFLDVLLDGPDGFSFLNELSSYSDTVKIPVVIITSLDLENANLSHYNVVKVLQKETMHPADIMQISQEVLQNA